MKNFLFSIRQRLTSIHRTQDGTALTEFVITLPVYLIFFSGILTLHQLQEVRLFSHKKTSAELWEKAIDVQTSYFSAHMNPGTGAFVTGAYYADSGDLGATAALDTGDAALGMYWESGLKLKALALGAPIFNANFEYEPQTDLAPDVMNPSSHAYCLMNDRIGGRCGDSDGGGGGSLGATISTLFDFGGARPGFAAGIRYGVVGAVDKSSYAVPLFDNSRPKARYNVTAPTYPNERWEALALTRLEMSQGHDGYDELLEWGIVTGSGSPSGVGQGSPPKRNQPPGEAEEDDCDADKSGLSPEEAATCLEASDDYMECIFDCEDALFPSLCRNGCPKPPSYCEDGGVDPDNFFDEPECD